MALPSPKFYTSTGGEITIHDFGSCEAGAYTPGSTGWSFRLYNDYGGSLGSDTMTSVKISIRDDDGGTDEDWTKQHWVQIKSSSGSTGVVDDAQTVFTAVGKNKELSAGDIPSGEYRTLFARCYPPTDAAEQNVEFQLRVTYQQPATSICNWITGLRGNGVVASTGDPFAMSTGGTTGTIPYEAGYALIYNNEIYFGSSGTYDCSTGSSGSNTVYLTESGSFGMTTGSVASNQLELYEATISSGGVCTALTDKRVYLAGLQAGTTGAIPPTPDKGDMYLDTANGIIYGAKTSTGWTQLNSTGGWSTTFVGLTDTPADFSGDASKILRVNSSSGAVEFVSSTGLALDGFGTPSTGTTLDTSTGRHGLCPKLNNNAANWLDGTGVFSAPTAAEVGAATTGVKLDDWATPDNNTDLNATTGHHGLLLALTGTTSNYLVANGTWAAVPGSTGGEANTASNQNTTGVGVYYQKSGIDLQFKGIRAGSSKVTVTDSTGTHTISLDLAGVLTSSGAFTANAIPQISSTGGVLKASPFVVTTGDVFNFGAHSAGFTEQAIAISTGNTAINWNSGIKALYTRSTGSAGAVTFTFTAPAKSVNLQLTIRGSTAGSTGTVTWSTGSTIYWQGGSAPTLSTGASAIDVVSFSYSTGLTAYLGLGSADFST